MVFSIVTTSIILASLAGYRYMVRRRRNKELYESPYFNLLTDEYGKALQDYKMNGKKVLRKYEQAI